MTTVVVAIGPVPGRSAVAWATAARASLATVRSRPDLGVPAVVIELFQRHLDLWGETMRDGEPFLWRGEIDADLLRSAAAHWARLVNLARSEGTGLMPADPEGEAFYDALAAGMGAALVAADDGERFAPKFEEVVPRFAAQPRHPTPFDTPAAAGRDTAEPAGARRGVLLVDDNEDIRLLVRIGLESSGGFDIVGEAANGQEAVEALDRGCPDVILLDLAMPVMDGFTALPLLRERCTRTRVVVFSATDSPATRRRMADSGCDAFLRKDAGIADIVATLRSLPPTTGTPPRSS